VLAALCSCSGCDSRQQVRVGDNAPEISGNGIHGENVTLDRFKGNVVVLYFWTNSCCGENVKLLEPFYRQFKDRGVSVLAVNVRDAKEVVESYVKSNALTFPIKTDERAGISEQFGVFGFPTIFIIDRNGIIRQKILGKIRIEQLQKLVVEQFAVQKKIDAEYGNIHAQ
jgi:peroxiredoxin